MKKIFFQIAVCIAFFGSHTFAQKANLWNYETTDGKGLQKSLQWLIPYLKNEKVWEFKQIKEKEYDDTLWLLKMALKKYANPMYDALAKNICQKDCLTDVDILTF